MPIDISEKFLFYRTQNWCKQKLLQIAIYNGAMVSLLLLFLKPFYWLKDAFNPNNNYSGCAKFPVVPIFLNCSSKRFACILNSLGFARCKPFNAMPNEQTNDEKKNNISVKQCGNRKKLIINVGSCCKR